MSLRNIPTLKASPRGKEKIQAARKARGWKYNAEEDDTPLREATLWLQPQRKQWWEEQWGKGEQLYADLVSAATWKRFQRAEERIKADAFEAFCEILGLAWEAIAGLDDTKLSVIGDPPDLCAFYGRAWYLKKLDSYVVQEHARLIAIYGEPGIGKTSLIRQWVEKIRTESSEFAGMIWLTPFSFLPDLFPTETHFSPEPISVLFELLKKQKNLIVLDRWTEILGVEKHSVEYSGEKYDAAKLLQKLAQQEHTNCLILSGDEKPIGVFNSVSSIRLMRLEELGKFRSDFCEFDDDKKILEAEGLQGSEGELSAFLTRYGNPSILKVIAARARVVFGGSVTKFISGQYSFILDANFHQRLERVWSRLSKDERKVMYCLAIRRESCSFTQLEEAIANFGIRSDGLIEILYSLIEQSLVECDEPIDHKEYLYSLSLVWQKFSTKQLIQESSEEIFRAIKNGKVQHTELFLGLAFVTLDSQDEQIKIEQTRRIVAPILNDLMSQLQDSATVREGLEKILASLHQYGSIGNFGIQNIEALVSKLTT